MSVKNEDSTLVFSPSSSSGNKNEFHKCLDEMNLLIQKIRIENQKQYQYFQNVVEHIGIGMISFDNTGKIELFNKAILDLLHLHKLRHITDLDILNPGFSEILANIKPGETRLINIELKNGTNESEKLDLSIKGSEFIILEKHLKLISFQNIKKELDGKELESWQKLTRVLSHEIMNSVSPLTSLAKTLMRYFIKDDKSTIKPTEIDIEIINKTIDGLSIIEERGKGLLTFVGDYRSYASLPKPVSEELAIDMIFNNIHKLVEKSLKAKNILIIKDIYPKNLKLLADRKFLDQILLNLVNNSISAFNKKDEDKIIKLKAYVESNDRIIIQVIDNGEGIGEDLQDKIFIPFFTTRKDGSGIGLSLSRQMMHLQGGSISVVSNPGVETRFTLNFLAQSHNDKLID